MNTINHFQADQFTGDFDALPLRSHVLFGAVPERAVSGDFDHAVSVAFGANDAAADWRVEAVRFRLHNPQLPLDLQIINQRTAARLYRKGIDQ